MPQTATSHRTCPLCEATCGLAIEIDPERREVLGIRGDREDPFSQGFLCPKAHGLKELHHDPDRLRRPVRRTRGGAFEEVSWEDGLDLAASKLLETRERHGAESLAIYLGNPTVHNLGASVYARFLIHALGTKRRFSATSVDQLPKMVSSCLMFGAPLSVPIPDLDRTQYLLVLGANPLVSNGSLLTAPNVPKRLRGIRERGGKVVVVDPRRTETARVADEHLAIRPGGDAFFLFAIVHVLLAEGLVRLGRLEEHVAGLDRLRELAADLSPERVAEASGIDAATTRRIARELAASESAACYGRIGTCTQEFGTLASWLVDVVNVLTGNLDREGGAMFPRSATGPAVLGAGRKGGFPYARWRTRVRGLPEFAGELPVAALAEEIDEAGEDRIRALVTVCGNPALSTPNGNRLERALASLDALVAIDLYCNETSRHADVILPGTGHLEHSHYDLAFAQLAVRNVAKWSPPTFPKPEGTLDDGEILLELSARLTGSTPEMLDEMALRQVLETGLRGTTTSVETARAELGDERGPDRFVDAMLRTGPWGDRFGEQPGGLSLAEVRRHPHGLDLGALEPALPDLLRTESGKVELAPEPIVADVPRLREALGRGANGLVLIGRRHLRSNNSWMHNVRALVKGPERCTLLVHPEDAGRIGLREGGRAAVRSRVGAVEVPVEVTDDIRPGVVSLPHGWGHGAEGVALGIAQERPGANSNLLSDEALIDSLSGNAVLNGIPVTVEPA